MAERAIRKSQFLTNLTTPTLSFDQLVRTKLESGKFPLTKTGLIKTFSIIILLAAIALFVGQTVCKNTPDWYAYLFPICIGLSIGNQFILYIIFSFGWTIRNPGRWVKIDIFCNLILAIIGIIASVLTITECSNGGTMRSIPGPLGITGNVLSIIGCAALFLMYRYVKENDEAPQTIQPPIDPRKSMHV